MIHDPHEVRLNDIPTLLEKEAREAIWTRSLVTGQVIDCFEDLTLDYRGVKVVQIKRFQV